MHETHSAWTVASGLLLVGIGVLAHYYGVPELVRELVSEKVALKKDSDALGRFRKTPQPLHFMVYLFHVENPEEVSGQGARPVLTEKGPYVYE
ncbi:Sensory neuron membrane protein 1 [Frankliniella fusca]|uniref:Sensory neuron membrane protein 2 n=1 Tax=Frankliniella fusca TaxID=407009 RepID=A0AAE1HT08_9NEOP|nr:Sensory neuron membrane protein 1 [Frankliniella fusca]